MFNSAIGGVLCLSQEFSDSTSHIIFLVKSLFPVLSKSLSVDKELTLLTQILHSLTCDISREKQQFSFTVMSLSHPTSRDISNENLVLKELKPR